MSSMMASVYDALVEAGASDTKARAAAEEVAGFESRFASVEREMVDLKGAVDRLRDAVRMQWVLSGIILAGILGPYLR